MSRMRRAWRIAGWSTAALVMTGVFAAYVNPHAAVDLANRVWACF